jgi:hypothetical protein
MMQMMPLDISTLGRRDSGVLDHVRSLRKIRKGVALAANVTSEQPAVSLNTRYA